MATHRLTIAKASFAAGLLRPDVTKVSRDDLAKFHDLLETAISSCSPRTVQTCKVWLLENIIPSTARTASFGKYLATLSKHLSPEEPEKDKSQSERKLSLPRRRLHILYILNDILHHVKYHHTGSSHLSSLTSSLRLFFADLFQCAVSEKGPRIHARLQDLLKIWKSEQYLTGAIVGELESIVAGSSNKEPVKCQSGEETGLVSESKKEPPFNMPSTHGDPAAPFWELPAGNMMPHIMPNSSTPIRPDRMRALQFAPGAPDEGLVSAVKDFLKDVDNMDNPSATYGGEEIVADIDELGQIFYKDEMGEVTGDTYYGWSRAFCEKMKRRNDDFRGRPGRMRSSTSRSSSRSTRKRRRYSETFSSESRSYSRSRSRSKLHKEHTSSSRDTRNGSSRHVGLRRPSSKSHSPEPFRATYPRLTQVPVAYTPQGSLPVHPSNQISRPSFSLPNANHSPHPFPVPPLGPDGFPIPPPRPPNWTGSWPPPPSTLGTNSPHGMSFPAPPLPPPPNLQQVNFYPPSGAGSPM